MTHYPPTFEPCRSEAWDSMLARASVRKAKSSFFQMRIQSGTGSLAVEAEPWVHLHRACMIGLNLREFHIMVVAKLGEAKGKYGVDLYISGHTHLQAVHQGSDFGGAASSSLSGSSLKDTGQAVPSRTDTGSTGSTHGPAAVHSPSPPSGSAGKRVPCVPGTTYVISGGGGGITADQLPTKSGEALGSKVPKRD